jgi:hypothetical protein
MLRKRNEEVPFVDFHAPLSTFDDKSLVMCEWTLDYEPHRRHLKQLRCAQELEEAQEDALRLEEELVRKKARIEILKKRLDEIKQE